MRRTLLVIWFALYIGGCRKDSPVATLAKVASPAETRGVGEPGQDNIEKKQELAVPTRVGDPRFPYPNEPALDVPVHEELLKSFKRAGTAQQTLFENADAILYASDDANWRMLDIRAASPDCPVKRALLTQKHTGEHWQNEVLRQWNADGSASWQAWSNGQPAGRWATWAPSGQILKLDFYKDGLKTGVSARWYPDGKKSSEWHYHDGNPSWGEAWDENGDKIIRDKPPKE